MAYLTQILQTCPARAVGLVVLLTFIGARLTFGAVCCSACHPSCWPAMVCCGLRYHDTAHVVTLTLVGGVRVDTWMVGGCKSDDTCAQHPAPQVVAAVGHAVAGREGPDAQRLMSQLQRSEAASSARSRQGLWDPREMARLGHSRTERAQAAAQDARSSSQQQPSRAAAGSS